jgi:dUTP pyrophosphatase
LGNKELIVNIQLVDPCAKPPEYAYATDAGADIRSVQDVWIDSGGTIVVDTGIRLEIPWGFEAQVRSRSGLARKGIEVLNSPGTIDPSYRGNIMVILHNTALFNYHINVGDRIAQLVFMPIYHADFSTVKDMSATERGISGIGSTGK